MADGHGIDFAQHLAPHKTSGRFSFMALDTLENTLTHELTDLLSAEKQFAKLLTQVAKAADSDVVKQMAQEHHAETLQQIENLQAAFEALGQREVAQLLQANLKQEQATAKKLQTAAPEFHKAAKA
jgi:ferritin-like metal-binding protein YciE